MQKKISIALATYNGERFLCEQLDSLYRQTYQNIEIIVGDDCSSDGTIKILQEYKRKYGLYYFVNKKNLGYIKNFEIILSKCTGEYIALSDQDDVWKENKLEVLLNNIGNIDLICSDAALINEKREIISSSLKEYQDIRVWNSNQFEHLLFDNFITGCTTLFRRNILGDIVFLSEGIPHDWWLGILASMRAGIRYLKEPLVLYRQHESNSIGAKKKNNGSINLENRKNKIIKEIDEIYKRLSLIMKTLTESNEYNFIRNNPQFKENLYNLNKIMSDISEYKSSIIRGFPLHLDAFRIAWKYRHYWFKNKPALCALGKLYG